MALYQRGRVWYADFYVQGKRVQESTGTANKREAEKFYALRMSEIHRGEYAKPVRISISEFGRQYMEYAKTNKRSWLRDQQIMTHLEQHFGNALLTDIGPLPIERYKQDRMRAVSPATVNREIALLKHMFNMAEQWGLYRGRNPVKGVKFLAEDNLQYRSLSDEEEAVLLKHCCPYLQDLVVFSINTGLRHGDVLNLKWKEVDLEAACIRMLIKKTREVLEIPLNDQAMKVVRAWHGMKKTAWVFYNPETGDQFKDLWLGLKKACRKAGLEGITWHTFRHTFASRLTGSGVDLVTVKELLGHSEISVTMRYAHTNRDAKRRAVKRLGAGSDKVVTISEPVKKPA
jgi:integrase